MANKKAQGQKTTIGAILKGIMAYEGISQQALAETLGYSAQSAIAERLRGDIRIGNVVKILNTLGYDLVITSRKNPGQRWIVEGTVAAPTPGPNPD